MTDSKLFHHVLFKKLLLLLWLTVCTVSSFTDSIYKNAPYPPAIPIEIYVPMVDEPLTADYLSPSSQKYGSSSTMTSPGIAGSPNQISENEPLIEYVPPPSQENGPISTHQNIVIPPQISKSPYQIPKDDSVVFVLDVRVGENN